MNTHRRIQRRSEDELQKIAKQYDFKKMNRFPKEVIYILENVFNNYSRVLSNILTTRFSVSFSVQLDSVKQMKYKEYMNQHTTPQVTTVFTLEPLTGLFFLNIDEPLAFASISSICGGTMDFNSSEREFTEIEKKLLVILGEMFLAPLEKNSNEDLDIQPLFKAIEFNLFNMQYISDEESIISIDLNVEVAEQKQYLVNYVFPYSSIEPIVAQLLKPSQNNTNVNKPSEEVIDFIETQVKSSEVELNVVLDKIILPLSRINQLKPGDLITLNRRVGDLLALEVENKVQFYVQPGMHNNKLATQVVKLANDKVEVE